TLVADPRYQALPQETRSTALEDVAKRDTRFQGLPDSEKAKVLNHAVSYKAPEAAKPEAAKPKPVPEESPYKQGAKELYGDLAKGIDMVFGLPGAIAKTVDQQARYLYETAIKLNFKNPSEVAVKGAAGDVDWDKYSGGFSFLVNKAFGEGTSESSYAGKGMAAVGSTISSVGIKLGKAQGMSDSEAKASSDVLGNTIMNEVLPHVLSKGYAKGKSMLGKYFANDATAKDIAAKKFEDTSIPKEEVVKATHSILSTLDEHINKGVAEKKAAELIDRGATQKEIDAVVRKDPLVHEALKSVKKQREDLTAKFEADPKTSLLEQQRAAMGGAQPGKAAIKQKPYNPKPEDVPMSERLGQQPTEDLYNKASRDAGGGHPGNESIKGPKYDPASEQKGPDLMAKQSEEVPPPSGIAEPMNPYQPMKNKQAGKAHPELLLGVAAVAAGASLDKDDPIVGGIIAGSLAFLASRGLGVLGKLPNKTTDLSLGSLKDELKPDISTMTHPQQLDDAIYTARTNNTADTEGIWRHIRASRNAGVTKGVDALFRDASEGSIKLNKEGQALYDKTVAPLRKLVNELRAKIGGVEADKAIEDLGTRIALNHRTWLDNIISGDPVGSGNKGGMFARTPGSVKPRNVFATDDGQIVTVKKHRGDDRYTYHFWENGEVVGTSFDKGRLGSGDMLGDVKLKEAKQRDIEKHSPIRYVSSDLAVWGLRAGELLKYAREKELSDRILNSKDSSGNALFPHEADGMHKIPPDYRKLTGDAASIPQFQGRYMPERYAEVIEDAAKNNKSGLIPLVNNIITRSFMLNFFPHFMNEFLHWWDARGASGVVTPFGVPMGASKGLVGLAKTLPDAVKSVITQDDFQMKILRNGGSLMAPIGRHATKAEDILSYALKDAVKTGQLLDIAKAIGTTVPETLKRISDGSAAIMWGLRDIMYTQLIKEQLLTTPDMAEAIKEVNRHMPSYRLPSRILGSRTVAKGMKSEWVQFSAYHHNMLSSLANMAEELASPMMKNKPNEFVKGLDRTLALAMASYIVFPALDSTYQSMFGSNDHKLTERKAGPLHLIDSGQEAVNAPSVDSFHNFAVSVVTPTPMFTIPAEILNNRYGYTGKKIVKPGTEGKDALRYLESKLKPVDSAVRVSEGKRTLQEILLEQIDVQTDHEAKRKRAEGYANRK
ncbi:MAG: hypothetical protein JHC33_06465, partial [Ignisphaera sp.]|nr:hypothetical protein [Ignisphaera sp.]